MSGLPWFKLSTDYFQHPKTNALKYELAEPLADAYPARIMAHLARFRPEGWITDAADDIAKLELSVGWGGTSGGLVEALIKVGIMDRRRGRLVLHGWVEWQEAHAKKAAMDRARMRARRAKPASSLDKRRATVARPSLDGRGLDRDGDVDRDGEGDPRPDGGASGEAPAAVEAFHREVAGLLGREPASLPIASAEAREGTTRDLAHHLRRLGLPRAVAVARRAISKQAGRDAPGSLAFFVGWLAQEPTAPAAPKRATGDLGVPTDEWWRRVTPERRAEFCAARLQLDPGLDEGAPLAATGTINPEGVDALIRDLRNELSPGVAA